MIGGVATVSVSATPGARPGPARRVVLVLPSATYRATDFLAAAASLGVEVVVASEFRQAMVETMGDRALQVDLCRPEEAARAIATAARLRPVEAVIAVDDQGVMTAALASAALGLAHNDPGAVGATRDKRQLRHRLAAGGVPQPAFAEVACVDQVVPEAARLGWPVVLKPAGLSASRGVIRADCPAQLTEAWHRIQRILAAAGSAGAEPLLLERFVSGPEMAVELVLEAGRLHVLAVFDKPDPLEGPFFEETIYVTPSRHAAPLVGEAVSVLESAVRAVGLTEGPVHAELRLGPAGPVVLELAARSIGGLCSRALRFGAGISLEELILRQALGLPFSGLERAAPASGVMMIPIPAPGWLHGVGGVAAARAVPLVQGVEISIHPGGRVEPLPEGDRYLGFIFAAGPSPDRVEQALRAALGELRIDIRDQRREEPGP